MRSDGVFPFLGGYSISTKPPLSVKVPVFYSLKSVISRVDDSIARRLKSQHASDLAPWNCQPQTRRRICRPSPGSDLSISSTYPTSSCLGSAKPASSTMQLASDNHAGHYSKHLLRPRGYDVNVYCDRLCMDDGLKFGAGSEQSAASAKHFTPRQTLLCGSSSVNLLSACAKAPSGSSLLLQIHTDPIKSCSKRRLRLSGQSSSQPTLP